MTEYDEGSPEESSNSPENKPTEERPYHAKRPHKKSRTGCKNCKARKVKCDEARPTCRACRLRKAECVYSSASPPKSGPASPAPNTCPSPNQTTSVVSIRTRETVVPVRNSEEIDNVSNEQQILSSSSSVAESPFAHDSQSLSLASEDQFALSPTVISEPMFRPAAAVDEIDMRLLWFYTSSTCSSFSVEFGHTRPVETLMRTALVQHAFETPFLMNSLFALSALHLQHLGSEIDPQRALHYRAKSFEGYRRAVEEGNPRTIPALLTNSLLLTALSSQSFRDPEAKDLYILDWMIVWRGIGLMITTMGVKSMVDAGLNALFYRPVMDLNAATHHIPNNLLFMVTSIPVGDIDYPDTQTYYNTLKYLGALYHSLCITGFTPVMSLRIITWFTFIPRRFADIGKEARPRVLVILAYYAMFLKLTPKIWWIDGIGERTLRDISKHIGAEWLYLIRIPLLTIGVTDPLEVARIVLQDPQWVSPSSPAVVEQDAELVANIRMLTWVDNIGRPVAFEDNQAVLIDPDPKASHPVWSL